MTPRWRPALFRVILSRLSRLCPAPTHLVCLWSLAGGRCSRSQSLYPGVSVDIAAGRSGTRMTARTRCDLKFLLRILKKQTTRKKFHFILFYFFHQKSSHSNVNSSPKRKMIKLQTFDNLYPSLRHFAKIGSGMTTATKFSRQNDAGSPARTT